MQAPWQQRHAGDHSASVLHAMPLFHVDRKKDMIKTGGENVASREARECICRLVAVSPRPR